VKLYLSGPMSGLPDYNRAAFIAAAAKLREFGHDVVSPVELDEKDIGERDWADYIARDVSLILHDDSLEAVVLLPGWTQSPGTWLEAVAATMVARRGIRPMKLYEYGLDGDLLVLHPVFVEPMRHVLVA